MKTIRIPVNSPRDQEEWLRLLDRAGIINRWKEGQPSKVSGEPRHFVCFEVPKTWVGDL